MLLHLITLWPPTCTCAMWHPPLGGYVPSGYPPQTTTSGDLPGQPMLAFNGGGFLPQGPPTAPNLPQSSPPGQWSQPGPAMWQPPSSTTPLGTFSGSQTTTGPPTFQGCSPATFPHRFQDLLCHLHLLEMPSQDLTSVLQVWWDLSTTHFRAYLLRQQNTHQCFLPPHLLPQQK